MLLERGWRYSFWLWLSHLLRSHFLLTCGINTISGRRTFANKTVTGQNYGRWGVLGDNYTLMHIIFWALVTIFTLYRMYFYQICVCACMYTLVSLPVCVLCKIGIVSALVWNGFVDEATSPDWVPRMHQWYRITVTVVSHQHTDIFLDMALGSSACSVSCNARFPLVSIMSFYNLFPLPLNSLLLLIYLLLTMHTHLLKV